MARWWLVGVVALVATACIEESRPVEDASGRDPSTPAAPNRAYPDGQDIVLVADGEERVVVTVPADEGELLHAILRPGGHEPHTVLALTRMHEPDAGSRYELRYLVVEDGESSVLFWFPLRLQIDAGVAEVLDVPPLPVWAPDGSAVAWIEWAADGTRLRTVGWRDVDGRTNPSDDAGAYALEQVPAGTQLEAWEFRDDGEVLVGRSDGERWDIRFHAVGAGSGATLPLSAA